MSKLLQRYSKHGIWLLGLLLPVVLLMGVSAHAQDIGLPSLNIQLGQAKSPQDVSNGLQILILLTVLTLAPSILIMTTAFTRIVIVLSLTRQAIGSPQLPPNQVIVGLALILTFFVMAPTFDKVNATALQPYLKHQIGQEEAVTKGLAPFRDFMANQLKDKNRSGQRDLALFMGLAKFKKQPKNISDIPTHVLLPAFIIHELKTAFQLGFVVFLPFLIIDVVVSSILVSMGMLFLPPTTISLPFKVVLFVLVDGWQLISKALITGFR